MHISLGTRIPLDKMGRHNGYGYATDCMVNSLQNLGYHIEENDASADVEIWFDQPQHWKFSKNAYKIGYHPWESTQLKEGWAEIMNKCDEIWTPSPLIADWYRRYSGITVPIYVYEHGIEHRWEPKPRTIDDEIRFLHVGAEATRKGGWTSVRLFRRAFAGYRNDVSLTLKMQKQNWNRIPALGRVNYINEKYSLPQLQDLFYEHHVYVYPSWGEGFGLTPLQALATGMPTITVPGWAPYARFIDPHLQVGSELKPSTWPKIHPGKMLRPNFDDVVEAMRYAADNYEEAQVYAQSRTEEIHHYYDWDRLTSKVFSDLEKRLKLR